MEKTKSPSPRLQGGSLVKWASRNFLYLLASLLALFPSVMKMYETSHWFREGDPSKYDNAKEWFSNPAIPFQALFDSPKYLMRVYFFIVPYILSALLIAIARMIPASTLPATLHHGQQPRRMIGSVLRRTLTLPSFLSQIGLPLRMSVGELLGATIFLILNIGTILVRVRRSLPRGSRKNNFLVDTDDAASREVIDPISWPACEVWAKTLGVISILNLGWYLLMPIGRKSVLLEALGMSWERGVKYHRWVGSYSVVIMLVHSMLYIFIWIYGDGHSSFDPDSKMIQRNMVPWYCAKNECDEDQARQLRVNLYGFVIMILIMVMTGFSLPWVRRNKFEWFYYSHHLFILVLVFVCLHYKGSIIYLIPGIAIYTVDKLMGILSYSKMAPVGTRMLSSDVLEINFEIGPGVEYKAGDYVFLNVPGASFLQWHPFSLTSAPNVHGKRVFFHLKDSGSWTKQVIEDAKQGAGILEVRLDGFYGVNNVCEQLQSKDGVILVGGGIGVTPMISLALGMCETHISPVTLFWVVRTIDEFNIFSAALTKAQRCYEHLTVKVWITLSRPEPSNKDEGLLKSELLEISAVEQVERVSKSLILEKEISDLRGTTPYVFTTDQSRLSGASNAIVMCISMLVGLVAFGWTHMISRREGFADAVVDKISFMELGVISFFVVVWIEAVVLVRRPLVRCMFPNYGLSSAEESTDCMDENSQNKNKGGDDVEGSLSDHEILQSMIRGNIGCRPNLLNEFASFEEVLASNTDSTVEIGVLACGPIQMVESINSICNVSSTCCYWGLKKDQQTFFSFTEEDWEW